MTGNYHAYTYGPERDGGGNCWVTLNLGMGDLANNDLGWHGWGGIIGEDGNFIPKAFGMRSPCGLGANRAGDMFFPINRGRGFRRLRSTISEREYFMAIRNRSKRKTCRERHFD